MSSPPEDSILIFHFKALAHLQTEVPGGCGYLAFASYLKSFPQIP